MIPGSHVLMAHPSGYATVTSSGGSFVGWIPNGVEGTIYLLTPDRENAVVHFDGKLIATVPLAHLRAVVARPAVPAA